MCARLRAGVSYPKNVPGVLVSRHFVFVKHLNVTYRAVVKFSAVTITDRRGSRVFNSVFSYKRACFRLLIKMAQDVWVTVVKLRYIFSSVFIGCSTICRTLVK